MAINYFDIFVIIAMAFFFIKGAYNGFFQEISGIIAIILSIFLLRMYGSNVADFIGRYSSSSLNYPFAIAIIVVGSFILVSLVTRILNKIMQITFTGWINRILGAIFGLVKGLLLTGIVAMIISWFLKDDPLITSSETIPYLLDIMKQVVDFVLGNYQVLQVEIWK